MSHSDRHFSNPEHAAKFRDIRRRLAELLEETNADFGYCLVLASEHNPDPYMGTNLNSEQAARLLGTVAMCELGLIGEVVDHPMPDID